jgi:ABC-type multidrug transport system fused ATPase/permease subunit
MIIKVVLFLTLTAFGMMMLADLLLKLSLSNLPGLFTQMGIVTLLSAFLLLVVTGLLMVFKRIVLAWRAYLSVSQRLQRRLWFNQAKQDRLMRLLYFRRAQISYFNKLKRKQLLSINDRQQLLAISKEITRDLLRIKRQLSKTTYVQLQKEHRQWLVCQDLEALLKLQQKIECFCLPK